MRILLLGPTAVGKTSVSIHLAESLNIPIISADSRQCYKHMDIGTATPDPEEQKRIKHYNISNLSPDQKDTAADFQERIQDWEEEILQTHDHVLYVGGSTLYLQVIIQPFDDIPDANSENIRKLTRQSDQEGIEPLYRKLQEVDPEYAESMDGMNPQRIIRALDVWMQTGRPFSSFHTQGNTIELPPDTLAFGLHRPRKKLHERINARVDRMFERGLIEEVKHLLDLGYREDMKALKTVGYREVFEYLRGQRDYESMLKDIKTSTRRYAKKQITWFRRWDFIRWLNAEKHGPVELAGKIEEKVAGMQNKS